jgi:protein-L-isoaspartate(D-aspartate) O-methyltransferase
LKVGEVDFAGMRAAMIASQLRTSDVNDNAVITAMSSVPREDFVPAARRQTCYIDRAIPLGEGRAMNPPLATGRLLTLAEINPGDKVLLLGDSTGYTAALLVHMGAQVTAVADVEKPENLPPLVVWEKSATAKGETKNAPYDVVLVDGAIEELPEGIVQQLADNGRVALGMIVRGVPRLCSGRKAGGVIGYVSHAEMEMAIVPGFAKKVQAFTF